MFHKLFLIYCTLDVLKYAVRPMHQSKPKVCLRFRSGFPKALLTLVLVYALATCSLHMINLLFEAFTRADRFLYFFLHA